MYSNSYSDSIVSSTTEAQRNYSIRLRIYPGP